MEEGNVCYLFSRKHLVCALNTQQGGYMRIKSLIIIIVISTSKTHFFLSAFSFLFFKLLLLFFFIICIAIV